MHLFVRPILIHVQIDWSPWPSTDKLSSLDDDPSIPLYFFLLIFKFEYFMLWLKWWKIGYVIGKYYCPLFSGITQHFAGKFDQQLEYWESDNSGPNQNTFEFQHFLLKHLLPTILTSWVQYLLRDHSSPLLCLLKSLKLYNGFFHGTTKATFPFEIVDLFELKNRSRVELMSKANAGPFREFLKYF